MYRSHMRTFTAKRTSRREAGFTLLELMAVLVIAAVLTAIAVPVYQSQVRQAQRSEAQAALSDAAARLDRYFFDNNVYTTDLSQVGYTTSTVTTLDGRWRVASAVGSSGSINTSYLLTATSLDTARDPECLTLTLSSQGQRGYTGSGADLDTCW